MRKPVKVRRERPNLSCTHFTAIFLYSRNIGNLVLFISGIKSLEIAVRIIYTTCRSPIVF